MIQKVLDGKREALRAEIASAPPATLSPAALPAFELADLSGAPLSSRTLAGKVVLVEFWATWCPPCRGTLVHLGELEKRYGDRLEVVALAVESDPDAVKKVADGLGLPLRWAMSRPEVAQSFGDLSAVPTLFLFGADGRTREIFYGAPPDLHDRLDHALAATMR